MGTHWSSDYDFAQSWTGQDWQSAAARKLRVDPYLVWADATDYRDLGGRPDGWVPVIIELGPDKAGGTKQPKTTTVDFTAALDQRADNQGAAGWIRMHEWYRNPQPVLTGATFCTAMVTKVFFEKLLTDPALQSMIVRVELALPIVHEEDIAV